MKFQEYKESKEFKERSQNPGARRALGVSATLSSGNTVWRGEQTGLMGPMRLM